MSFLEIDFERSTTSIQRPSIASLTSSDFQYEPSATMAHENFYENPIWHYGHPQQSNYAYQEVYAPFRPSGDSQSAGSDYFSLATYSPSEAMTPSEAPSLSSTSSIASTVTSVDEAPDISVNIKGKISRPPNSWILYRSDKLLEAKQAQASIKTPQAELSKMIAERWRSEPVEVKRKYEYSAQLRKQEHDAQYPGYKFKPRKRGEKAKDGARTTVKSRATRQSRRSRAPKDPPTSQASWSSNVPPSTWPCEDGHQQSPSEELSKHRHKLLRSYSSDQAVKAQLNAIWNSNEKKQCDHQLNANDQWTCATAAGQPSIPVVGPTGRSCSTDNFIPGFETPFVDSPDLSWSSSTSFVNIPFTFYDQPLPSSISPPCVAYNLLEFPRHMAMSTIRQGEINGSSAEHDSFDPPSPHYTFPAPIALPHPSRFDYILEAQHSMPCQGLLPRPQSQMARDDAEIMAFCDAQNGLTSLAPYHTG